MAATNMQSLTTGFGDLLIEEFQQDPLFTIDLNANGIIPHNALTRGEAKTIAGASARKDIGDHPVWIQVAEELSHSDVVVDDILVNFLRQVVWIIVPVLSSCLLLTSSSSVWRLDRYIARPAERDISVHTS